MRSITGSFVFSGIAFAGLCTLNCFSIAFWERELDERQGKISFATRYPDLHRHLGKLLIARDRADSQASKSKRKRVAG